MKALRDKLQRKEKIAYIPIEKITPDPSQPRRRFEESALLELASSIRENGLLQPLTVRRAEGGWGLVAGERRFRACHIAGISEIPCVVIEADEKAAATLTLLENLQRADLSFLEEARGIERLMRIGGYTQEAVAEKIGKSQSAVSNKLRLLKLPREVLSALCAANLCERHARAILRLSSREEQIKAAEHIIEEKLNVTDAEKYIDRLLSAGKGRRDSKNRSQYVIKDMRLFYNTVDRAVDTMRRAGFSAEVTRNEDERGIHLNISIYK